MIKKYGRKSNKAWLNKNALITCAPVMTNGVITANTTNRLLVNHAYAILATFLHK